MSGKPDWESDFAIAECKVAVDEQILKQMEIYLKQSGAESVVIVDKDGNMMAILRRK